MKTKSALIKSLGGYLRLGAAAGTVLLSCGLPLNTRAASGSPVGIWDVAISGSRQGLAQMSFSGGGTNGPGTFTIYHCSHAWFLKLDSTIEEVEDRGERGQKPKYPLKLLERINSSEKLKSYLDALQLSDVANTGLDNRFELNIALTSIERFIVGHVGRVYDFPAGMKEALFAYEDRVLQNPETGFFGASYRLPDGTIRQTADLSVTFHIVS